MDIEVEEKVGEILHQFIKNDKMFTAFDITKSLRNLGMRIRHNTIRDFVVNSFQHGEMSGYDRDLIDVNASVPSWLYFPNGKDPATYDPHAIKDVNAVQKNIKTRQRVASQKKNVFPIKSRKRLIIPAHFVRQIGALKGEYVFAHIDNGKGRIIINKKQVPQLINKRYTVDRYNNITLSLSGGIFNNINLQSKNYKIDGNSTVIEITKHV